MKIYLADVKPQMREAWKIAFKGVPDVEVYEGGIGSIFDLKVDALVSPANGFCFMCGGIDAMLTDHLGQHVPKRLQKKIQERDGELIVGSAEWVFTDHPVWKFLIAAPTMRTPTRLPENSVNVFLATRAALFMTQTIQFLADTFTPETKLESIAFPGMGTGVGAVPPERAAIQMRAAYDWVFNNKRPDFTWDSVLDHENLLIRSKLQ